MPLPHLLIVEDEAPVRELLAEQVRQLGCTVTAVDGTAAADAALAATAFDLILSDVHLPGNRQLRWVERVLAREFPPPVLLMTGQPELETTLRAANLPVAGYLIKPPDFATLGTRLLRLVAAHRRRRELHALAREAAALLAADDPLQARLRQLADGLAAEAARPPRGDPPADPADAPWRAAIAETIAVLEKTKDSFRSKELGRLRGQLQRLLTPDRAA